MLAKTVGCWRYGYWQELTLFYEPLPKGGIPPEQHPAVQEDEFLTQATTFLVNYQARKGWRQGETRDVIINYLRLNGPQIISTIAEDIGGNAVQVTSILRRYPDKFKVVGQVNVTGIGKRGCFVSKAQLWGLVEVEN